VTHDQLARLLLDAVRIQHFERTEDKHLGGAPLRHFPSIDLAVAAFPDDGAPVWANVLFSREHPRGFVADIGSDGGAVRHLRFDADVRDDHQVSVAWLPDADWQRLRFPVLCGEGRQRFVAPYPASLAKLMPAIGVARLVDQGRCGWDDRVEHDGTAHTVAGLCEDMITVSGNNSTTALVALLHRHGVLGPAGDLLEDTFALYGLPTLKFANTRPDGGWGNAAGAGVGQLCMTAWDVVRLLWLIDDEAPAPPWLPAQSPPLLSADSRTRLRGWLDDQALHEILSSTALAGERGWVAGLPAALPARWIDDHGAVQAGGYSFAADVRAAARAAKVRFAHKTGTTENYASDAGIVRGIEPARACHYIVALLTNLGTRYAPSGNCATTWRVPALGRTLDAALFYGLRS
jgi:Beta-lactamase enzyme family